MDKDRTNLRRYFSCGSHYPHARSQEQSTASDCGAHISLSRESETMLQ